MINKINYRLSEFVATGIYTGYLPKAPGTWGTLVGIPLAIGLAQLELPWRALALIMIALYGIYVSNVMVARLGQDDPGCVVIDEIAGYAVALFFFEPTWQALLAGFIFFRIFDISKPPPVRNLERLHGGTGIMLDDLMAGVFAGLCLLGLHYIWPQLFMLQKLALVQ